MGGNLYPVSGVRVEISIQYHDPVEISINVVISIRRGCDDAMPQGKEPRRCILLVGLMLSNLGLMLSNLGFGQCRLLPRRGAIRQNVSCSGAGRVGQVG